MDNLPLLELFTRLRQAGLPLGMEEYQLALKAMQGGFGLNGYHSLKRLCQLLWVKSEEERRLLEHHFDQVMNSDAMLIQPPTRSPDLSKILPRRRRYLVWIGAFWVGVAIIFAVGSQTEEKIEETVEQTPIETPSASPTSPEIAIIEQIDDRFEFIFWSLVSVFALATGGGLAWGVDRLLLYLSTRHQFTSSSPSLSFQSAVVTQKIQDEIQVAQLMQQPSFDNRGISDRFVFSQEYLPVTQRQMKRSWRYLYRPVREGLPTELDIDATIQHIGQQGLCLEPVLVPRRINRAELLLLIDQEGSMVPFYALSQRLINTAVRGGRLGNTSIYYFHNCPIAHFYRDPDCCDDVPVDRLLAGLAAQRVGVLIFSDAGAARGGLNRTRIEKTKEFLIQLKQQIRYMAWVNPMPKTRWQGTSAEAIAQLLPMFEFSRTGLDGAIAVLKGRQT